MYHNVLITSISKKVPLIKAVKKGTNKISEKIKVFGCDLDSNCLGKYFVDTFISLAKLSDLKLKDILEICNMYGIGLIIPTRDGELEFFSQLKNELKLEGVEVMVSNINSVKICLDKILFSKIDNTHFIRTYKNIDEFSSNYFVVKEQFGAGSKSIGIKLNKLESKIHSKKLLNPIFQPFIDGKEISIDAYITKENEIKGIVMRNRVLVVDGESQITSTFSNKKLENELKKVIKLLNLNGHIMLQAILGKNSDLHIIECNARFGGASNISIEYGLDSFYWIYLESLGLCLKDFNYNKREKEITQIRHLNDIYIYDNSI